MWSRTEGWADASAAVAVVLERTVEDRDPAADVGGWFCSRIDSGIVIALVGRVLISNITFTDNFVTKCKTWDASILAT